MADILLRNDIGVRNPFAYAEAKLGKDIDWRSLSARKQRFWIEKGLGAPYAEIFNPKNTDPALIHPVKSGSGDPVMCDAAKIKTLIAGWGKNPFGDLYCEPAGTYGAYYDPVQGALSDCFFMASLAAIAFANKTNKFFKDVTGASVDLTFYDNITKQADGSYKPTTSKTVNVTKSHFPLATNGKLVFARSNTTNENWPAMYEKGFAEFKSGGTTDEPDYSKLCQGNPITALANITNYKYSDSSTFETKNFATGADIYKAFLKNCVQTVGRDRSVNWPMVAYTYDSTAIAYSNSTIVRNHSYSVLGVQQWDANSPQYIILRNPWGQVPPPVIVDPGQLHDRCVLDDAGNIVLCYGDPKLGADVLSQNSWFGINLAEPSDAIFGLNVNSFRTFFQGFGWVYT